MIISQFSIDEEQFDGVFSLSDLRRFIESVQPLLPLDSLIPDFGSTLLRLSGLRIAQQGRHFRLEIDEVAVWSQRKLTMARNLCSHISEQAEDLYLVAKPQRQSTGSGLAWSGMEAALEWDADGAEAAGMKLARLRWENDRPVIDPYWWPELACIASDPRSVAALEELRELYSGATAGLRRRLRSTRVHWDAVLPWLLDCESAPAAEGSRSSLTESPDVLDDGELVGLLIERKRSIGQWPEKIGDRSWMSAIRPTERFKRAGGAEECVFELPQEVGLDSLFLAVNCASGDNAGCVAQLACGDQQYDRPLTSSVPRIVGRLDSRRFRLSISNGYLTEAAIYH